MGIFALQGGEDVKLVGTGPAVVVQLALFLQVETTLSAAAYYRDELATALRVTPSWGPATAYEGEHALVSYIVVASLFTGLVGIPLYVYAVDRAVVGYVTIDALMRVVERVPFATVCFVLGAIAIVGRGGIAVVV